MAAMTTEKVCKPRLSQTKRRLENKKREQHQKEEEEEFYSCAESEDDKGEILYEYERKDAKNELLFCCQAIRKCIRDELRSYAMPDDSDDSGDETLAQACDVLDRIVTRTVAWLKDNSERHPTKQEFLDRNQSIIIQALRTCHAHSRGLEMEVALLPFN